MSLVCPRNNVMPKNEPNLLHDGFTELRGCDGSERPLVIPKNYVHHCCNCDLRGGVIKPRYGYRYIKLTFENESTETRFNGGIFQCAKEYLSVSGTYNSPSQILVVKGGRLFRLTQPEKGLYVEDVTPSVRTLLTSGFTAPALEAPVVVDVQETSYFKPGDRLDMGNTGRYYKVLSINSATQMTLENTSDIPGTIYVVGADVIRWNTNKSSSTQAWMEQADQWMVIQDGFASPMIYDGLTTRRGGIGEIRTGTVMAYGRGRLWVATYDGQAYYAGDIIGGASGSETYNYRDAVLKVQENDYLAENKAFNVPSVNGRIRAMMFLSDIDQSFGQGPLQILTEYGVFSVNSPSNTSDWQSYNAENQPLVTQSLFYYGAEGARNAINVNEDILYRSQDGIRSWGVSRNEFTSAWTSRTISAEMDWVLSVDQPSLLGYGSSAVYKNRFFTTCSPAYGSRGVYHRGLVVLDLLPSSKVGRSNVPPIWNGFWEGLHIYQLMKIRTGRDTEVCLMFTENNDGDCEVFSMPSGAIQDQSAGTVPTRIRWWFETGGMSFNPAEGASGVADLKELVGGEMRVANLVGDVTTKLRWRPDLYACWLTWAEWKDCADVSTCNDRNYAECSTMNASSPAYRALVGITKPPKVCDPVTKMPLTEFYTLQLRADVQGYMEIPLMVLVARSQPQPMVARPTICKLYAGDDNG